MENTNKEPCGINSSLKCFTIFLQVLPPRDSYQCRAKDAHKKESFKCVNLVSWKTINSFLVSESFLLLICEERWELLILDFATTISEVLNYNPDSKVWECAVCGRSNSDKNQVRRHAEVHFKGFIHTCPYCAVEKKTSTALRVHIHRFHTKKP